MRGERCQVTLYFSEPEFLPPPPSCSAVVVPAVRVCAGTGSGEILYYSPRSEKAISNEFSFIEINAGLAPRIQGNVDVIILYF